MKIIEFLKPGIRKPYRKFLLLSIVVYASVFQISHAQTISGGTLLIGSGAIVSSNNDMTMTGGALNVQGTLILKKNLDNQNVSSSNLGTGVIEFSGTTPQTISGVNVIGSLTMNNATGLTVAGNTQVNGTLTLTSGLITLGASNLTLGPAASVAGTPSATKMVVATGTGQMRKEFAPSTSFTFPVGDNDGTAEYSPVALTFGAGGTFPGGNYAGVNLIDDFYTGMTTPRLTRNWTITQSGISGFSANATFTYVDADLDLGTGVENDIYTVKVAPEPVVTYSQTNAGSNLLAANGLTSFSTFTGAKGIHEVNLTAFLEGPYNSGSMNTTLMTGGYLPLTQPYNTTPWNYTGSESVGSIPDGVVDWILIELRVADLPENANSGTVVNKRAAFLKSNGAIVDLDGTSPLKFTNTNIDITKNLYPVIKHRNHLAIMSSAGLLKPGGVYTYNFTDAGSKTYGYPDGIKQLGPFWAMIGGNGYPDADINTDDLTYSFNSLFGFYDGYYSGDFDLSGQVDTDDLTYIFNPNFGMYGNIADHKKTGFHSMVP